MSLVAGVYVGVIKAVAPFVDHFNVGCAKAGLAEPIAKIGARYRRRREQ
jgi:hypothetical protein